MALVLGATLALLPYGPARAANISLIRDAEIEALTRPAGALAGDPGLRDEVRQLVVARNERRRRQGKEPLDVEAETEKQLADLIGSP